MGRHGPYPRVHQRWTTFAWLPDGLRSTGLSHAATHGTPTCYSAPRWQEVETGLSSEKLFYIKNALTEAEAAKRGGDMVKARTHPCSHLHRDRAHPCHICTGTGLTPPASAPGLGSPLPQLHRVLARPERQAE
jgi:hypothetical protein